MKRLILFVFVSMIVSSNLLGQSLPTSADNSQWFPPVRSQAVLNNCTHFSLVYYLKSSIWNRQYNRNPNLEVNQFSHAFVWNQNVDPIGHYSGSRMAGEFMIAQGCATVQDFPLNEQTPDIFPSLEVKEKALAYKTKKITIHTINSNDDSSAISQQLHALKDSLAHGHSFTISFPLYNYFYSLSNGSNIYNCYQGISSDSMRNTHVACIVGYNDTVKTAQGRGAFMVINSNKELVGGHFWLDYNWLYFLKNWAYECCFLEEDFEQQFKVSLGLKVSNYVNGVDRFFMNNIIIDSLYFDDRLQRFFDFPDITSGIHFPNLVRLVQVNGKQIVNRWTNLYMPLHNHEGMYELVNNLSEFTDSFTSASVVIYDPIAGQFKGTNGNMIYEYQRTSSIDVEDSYIKLLGEDKKIIGRVTVLSDTTVVLGNYWSYYLAYHVPGNIDVFVSQSTCTFKRYLVTFSDTLNAPPVLVTKPDTLLTNPDSIVTFQFEAYDPDGDSVRYSVSGDSGASINSVTGLFSYKSSRLGSYDLKIMITDGSNAVTDSFIVRVDNTVGVDDDPFAIPTEYSLSQNYPNPFNPTTAINFSIVKSGPTSLKVYNLLGQEVALLVDEVLSAGTHNANFVAGNLSSGIYIYVLKTQDFSATKKMILMK